MIRKLAPLPALLLAFLGLLTVGGVPPVYADARPTIVSITLDDNNHAVVTWTKESWQGSTAVKWSTGDGAVAAPYANWDGHYGLPLVDCYGQPLDGNPFGGDSTHGQWNYGQHCNGQDVGDAVTKGTTWEALPPGVYYFQVTVAGEDHQTGRACNYQDKMLPTECLSEHYSDVVRLTVRPDSGHSPGPSIESSGEPGSTDEPGSSAQPGQTAPVVMNGPGQFVPVGGGQVDVGAGGRVVANPPFNLDVGSGQMHLRENLVSFHCPSWTQPFPPETTLQDWIGVRCRTVTTPQAGALVKGTEFSVTVSAESTTFWVFEGQIEVSDLSHRGAVLLGPGQTTTVFTGKTPTAPAAFDTGDSTLRWWESEPSDAEVAVIVLVTLGLFFLVYFLPAIVVLARRPERWRMIGLLDLLAGWTVIGWIVALALALTSPRPSSNATIRPVLSPDGRWWWDGYAWRPVPPGAGR